MAAPLTYFYSKTPGVDYLLRSVPSGFVQTKWSFSTWFKLPSTFTFEYEIFFSILDDNDGGTPDDECSLSFASTGDYIIYYYGGNYSYFYIPSGLQTDTLYCLQFDYDSTNSTEDDRIRLYLNGTRLAGYEALPGYWFPPAQYADAYSGFVDPTYVISGYLLGVDAGNGIGEYSPQMLQGRTFLVTGDNPVASDVYAGTLPSEFGTAGFLLLYETAGSIADDSSGNNNDFTLVGDSADSWFAVPYKDLLAQWNLDAITVEAAALFRWNVLERSAGHVVFSDSSAFTHIWGAVDAAQFSDFLSSFLFSVQSVSEALSLVDAVAYAYPLLSFDSIALTSPVAQILRSVMSHNDVVQLAETVDMQRTHAMGIATALVLSSVLETIRQFDELVDAVGFVDSVVEQIRATADVVEQLLVESQASDYLVIFTASSDAFAFADTAAQFSSVFDHVGDTINFFGSLGLDNEDYMVWAVHTQYPAATEYQNYEFNSFAQVGNVYLGAADDGIYELSGSDDAGADIAAVVRTGLFDFGSAQLKQVVRAYLGYTSEHRLVLKTIATDGGAKVERWYELREKPADEVRESRIKLGKGVKSRYWQFELVNVDGGEFEVDQLHLMPVMLSRRVKE